MITETFEGSELIGVTVESLDGVITVDGEEIGEGDAPLELVVPVPPTPSPGLGGGLGSVIAGGAQQAQENRAAAAGQQQISPPSTGDAGLAPKSKNLFLIAGVIGLVLVGASGLMASHRKGSP